MSQIVVPSNARTLPDPRSRILAAAGEIFLREGFAGTSVDAVAATARMSKESIYDAFPTKSALFEAAVRASIDKYTYDNPKEGPARSIDGFLAHMGISMFDRFIEPVNFGLFRNNIEAANHFPELAATLHEHRRQASQANASYLQCWIDSGCLRVTDAVETVIRFSSLCIGGSCYFLGAPLPTEGERKQRVQRTVSLFLDGYGSTTTEEAPTCQPAQPAAQSPGSAVRMSPGRIREMLASIEDEFLAHGYRSASIERAVSAVKVGKTTVYRQFGNKEGVFRHIIGGKTLVEAGREYDMNREAATIGEAVAHLARQALDIHCDTSNIRLHRLLIQESERFPDLARDFYNAKVRALGKALLDATTRFGGPIPDAASMSDFYNLATSALRYVTTTTLPSPEAREREAHEASRVFLYGVRS